MKPDDIKPFFFTHVETMDVTLPDGTIATLTIKHDEFHKHDVISMLTYVKPKTAFEKLVDFIQSTSTGCYTQAIAEVRAKALLEIQRVSNSVLWGLSDGFAAYANSYGIPPREVFDYVTVALEAGF